MRPVPSFARDEQRLGDKKIGVQLMPPVLGSVMPLSFGCWETRLGVVPSGTIQANSPVLRSTAVIRL